MLIRNRLRWLAPADSAGPISGHKGFRVNVLSNSPPALADAVVDARRRSLELVGDLDEDQLLGVRLSIINPLLWELGHLAWFSEKWVLRHAGKRPPLRNDADALFDSATVPHDTRWDLLLPSRAATLDYLKQVQERILDLVYRGPTEEEKYFILLSIFHEDMHGEAFFYTRQTLGYPRPSLSASKDRDKQSGVRSQESGIKLLTPDSCLLTPDVGPLPGDVQIPGGTFLLGAGREEPFVFDNEKWAHPVLLRPFAIARVPVTQAEFAAFVADDGYCREELWGAAGWHWRQAGDISHPMHWRREGNDWLRRDFDRWLPLEPHRPVIHVNWYEAEAYCRWARRRLPTEAEWEAAAAASGHDLSSPKRRFPWGDEPPTAESGDPYRAQLDGYGLGCCDVASLPPGDSYFGCRQMVGNVWEWTASDFLPYPGFVVDPYREYSQPWFGTHKVLRGGAWMTRSRLLRNTWRNFYLPDRRDVWAGFRTCALSS
jgi:iron(II)-dependent oxidoreductase